MVYLYKGANMDIRIVFIIMVVQQLINYFLFYVLNRHLENRIREQIKSERKRTFIINGRK
jgi:Na+/melibiose symporter-like transporter